MAMVNGDPKAEPLPEENEEIWSTILQNVASNKIVQTKNIIILGDSNSGKTSLVNHLRRAPDDSLGGQTNGIAVGTDTSEDQRDIDQKNELALSYSFVDVRDDENEETIARIGLYQLAGSDNSYHDLLRFSLNANTFSSSLIVIVLDWSKPWTFIETFERWIKLIEEVVESVKAEGGDSKSDNPDKWTYGKFVIDEAKEKLERYIQEYTDPSISSGSPAVPHSTVTSSMNSDVLLPLGPGCLTTNLGIPIVVACTKSDVTALHEREMDYKEEQFDFIQQALRTLCLKYGAALFYTSSHRPETLASLRQYLLHRLLGIPSENSNTLVHTTFPFNTRAQVVERDLVIVPSGWDSWGKIKVLRDGFDCELVSKGFEKDLHGDENDPDSAEDIGAKVYFESIVKNLSSVDQAMVMNPAIIAEDEQAFLERHYEVLQRTAEPTGPGLPLSNPGYSTSSNSDDVAARLARLAKLKEQHGLGSSLSGTRPGSPGSGSLPSSPSTSNTALPVNGGAGPNQNEVIANFFQSLITRRASSGALPTPGNAPGSPTTGRTSSSTRRIMATELDRLKMAAGNLSK
ncbi:dynein light intermediate chain [Basidiobolus meristosporus CBS 931.73]|uniref:Dynein light intermediate chain n=1 Tax=Basidiobolus meristosporus CBS 931.73 TaxID=1314790 RepID=A0A1Y1XNM7_9FUNG|nr:dynein light intermediate chain [Basidiobolus meristosporus CBS 931.73]|eukprot:ORX87357.1 dynein light intermediate chain [Basidiobolus meristosporus CBS 931.73]